MGGVRNPVLTCVKKRQSDYGRPPPLISEQGMVAMNASLRNKILELLDRHRLMTVATNRPDGWPQATTVGYVNDGLTLYFLCAR